MSFLKGLKRIGQTTTQLKIKRATDSDELDGATGALMNELSVLTYSEKSASEIYEVIRKRLMNGNSWRRNSHDSVIQVLKTLTIIEYLLDNGSEEFVTWMKRHLAFIEALKDYQANNSDDNQKVKQIRRLARDLSETLRDENLLDKRRSDIIMFRSSVSTPGRKSTDNSHLTIRSSTASTDADVLPAFTKDLQSRSLDLQRRKSSRASNDRIRYLATLAEEEDGL